MLGVVVGRGVGRVVLGLGFEPLLCFPAEQAKNCAPMSVTLNPQPDVPYGGNLHTFRHVLKGVEYAARNGLRQEIGDLEQTCACVCVCDVTTNE